jgi:FkbM family methyltransferase
VRHTNRCPVTKTMPRHAGNTDLGMAGRSAVARGDHSLNETTTRTSLKNALIRHSPLGAKRARAIRTEPALATPQAGSKSTLACLVAYNEFGGYCIPRSSVHRPAVQAVLAGNVWERDTVEYMTSHTDGGDVIHAGTYFGDALPALSKACPGDATVWAFEPNPENHLCASMTVLLNRLDNVRLTNAGLGSAESTAAMATRDESGRSLGGASRILPDELRDSGSAESIRIVSIDEVVPEDRNISVIHLDVEGYEKAALSGALRTIERCRPTLILETLPEEPWLSDAIFDLGYQVSHRVNANSVLTVRTDR